jgi:hypothetical protein
MQINRGLEHRNQLNEAPMNKKNAQRISISGAIAALGWTLAVLLVILNYVSPHLKTRENLPDTRIYITQSRNGEGDEVYYGMIVRNSGTERDEEVNVKFILNSPSLIKTIRIHNTSRVKLIEREMNSAAFVIKELYPEECEIIDLKVAGEADFSVNGWSKKSKRISKIFNVGLKIGPEESYEDWKKKSTNPKKR